MKMDCSCMTFAPERILALITPCDVGDQIAHGIVRNCRVGRVFEAHRYAPEPAVGLKDSAHPTSRPVPRATRRGRRTKSDWPYAGKRPESTRLRHWCDRRNSGA